jgi:hypothetical protein
MTRTSTTHIAGEYRDLMQHCTRCGAVLSDDRNTMYMIADGPPRGWPLGEVTIRGNMTATGRLDGSVDCESKRLDS